MNAVAFRGILRLYGLLLFFFGLCVMSLFYLGGEGYKFMKPSQGSFNFKS